MPKITQNIDHKQFISELEEHIDKEIDNRFGKQLKESLVKFNKLSKNINETEKTIVKLDETILKINKTVTAMQDELSSLKQKTKEITDNDLVSKSVDEALLALKVGNVARARTIYKNIKQLAQINNQEQMPALLKLQNALYGNP